ALAQETLTLADAVRIARAHHPTVAAQKAQLEAARARREQSFSGFWPALTGNFSYVPQTANFAATPGFKRILARPATSGVDTVVDTSGTPIGVTCSPVGGSCTTAPPAAALPDSYALSNFWAASIG